MKKEITPFIITFFALLLIEGYLSKSNFLFITFSIFWKLCLIFLIRFVYIKYNKGKL